MSSNSPSAAGWPVPNYINPETRGPAGKIIGSTLISLVTVVLILRMYTRQFISRSLGLDDVLILISYVPATAYAVLGVYGEVYLQWNRHIWDVEPRLYVPSLQSSLAELILFDLSTSTTKLSMLAMIHRVTSSSKNKTLNTVVITLASSISINAFIFLVVSIFQCSPISAYWTITSAPKRCINQPAHLLAAGIINTITDFIIVFLPMQIVMHLDLPRKQRYIVIGLFGAGFLACAAGIVRIVFTWLMTTATNRDTTWNAWSVWVASGIELYVGIICASIPAIKPFFATYLPKFIDASIRSHKSSRDSKDPKSSYPSADFSGSNSSFQTFIYGPSTPAQLMTKPKSAMPAQHKKPPSASRALPTSFIQPVLDHKKSPSVNMNKPLPVILDAEQLSDPRLPSLPSQSSLPTDEDKTTGDFSSQRNALRFTNTSSVPYSIGSASSEDRTTVLIMYQGDE
ncbi:hypothetical protein SUNI508_09794 [Seiridium unicorne]|uniref:Rhodopsin domain-containing protein n=1 Tax=Seiridium unicorne TaxID=138068 RepID=A0ABR2UNW1_9PEZI